MVERKLYLPMPKHRFLRLKTDVFGSSIGVLALQLEEELIFTQDQLPSTFTNSVVRIKEKALTGKYWVPDVINMMKKLKISCIGGKWRLNEVTKAQRELFKLLDIDIQS